MRTRSTIKTDNGITWYYEQEGSGPHIVLIPDGYGDCEMFDKPMSLIAKSGFTVTTFDSPGLSRSHDAPPETYTNITSQKLASYIISLLDALDIKEAAFWGSSAGGATVLALVQYHPKYVRNGLPHEVPTFQHDDLTEATTWDDATISREFSHIPVKMGLIDAQAWQSLGPEVHTRLSKNYPRWLRGYFPSLSLSVSTEREDLLKKPMDWTVGAITPTGAFADNIVTATKVGIGFQTLAGGHFPYVCHPQEFSEYVVRVCRKYL